MKTHHRRNTPKSLHQPYRPWSRAYHGHVDTKCSTSRVVALCNQFADCTVRVQYRARYLVVCTAANAYLSSS